nr:putative stress up-regulated Nod 19 [Ipomoea batatas]
MAALRAALFIMEFEIWFFTKCLGRGSTVGGNRRRSFHSCISVWGLRHEDTDVLDPYGIEVGNPPEGYGDAWELNLHMIDTRGTVDSLW